VDRQARTEDGVLTIWSSLKGLIYGPDNKPVAITKADAGRPLHEWTTFDRYPSDPSSGLTPATLARIISSALSGAGIAELMDLYDGVVLKDWKVRSQYRTRRMAVSRLGYEINPASDDPKDVEIADYVREQFAYIDDYSGAIHHLMDATGRGFAVLEPKWEFEGSERVCRRLAPVEARRFVVDAEDRWAIRLYSQQNPTKGEQIPFGRAIVHVPDRAGNPIKHGDLMTCLWLWLFKAFDIKSWQQFLEVYGWPFRLGRYEPGTSDDDIKALLSSVLNLGRDAGAVIPKSTEIEMFWAQGQKNSDAFQGLVEYCDRMQSEVITGQSLATSEGTRGSGSYAQAQVHDDVKHELTESDGLKIDHTMETTLIAWQVDYKFGPQKRYPRHHLLTEPPEDVKMLSGVYKDAVESGQPIGHKHYSERFNIPLPEGDEPILVPPKYAQGGGPGSAPFDSAQERGGGNGKAAKLKDEPAPSVGGARVDRDVLADGGASAAQAAYDAWIARIKEAQSSGRDL